MLSMRTLLLVSADSEEAIEQARGTQADVIVLDLEDNVAPSAKAAARGRLRERIAALQGAGRAVFVRVNGLSSGLTRDDLVAAVGPGLDGLVHPKTEAAQQVRQLDVLIREQETRSGVKAGGIVLLPQIESARGLLRCEEIVLASSRIGGAPPGGRAPPGPAGSPPPPPAASAASRWAGATSLPTWASRARATAASCSTPATSSPRSAPPQIRRASWR